MPEIPTFDQFKAQQAAPPAIPTFDQFKAAIPPNPSDSIPSAAPPVPAGLRGPAPSRLSQAVTNLPYSAVNSLENTLKGPQMGGDDAFHPSSDGMSSFQRIGKFLEHPVDNTLDWAVNDPVTAAQQAVALGRGGHEVAPAVADAVAETAPKVVAVVKGAAQGAKEGATSTMPVAGHSYAARALKAVGVDKVPTVPVAAIAGKYIGHALFGPEAGTAGEVVGAATPIVRGAWRGAKQALQDLQTPPSVEPPPPPPPGSPVVLGEEQGAPLPESRQLEAGPRVIVPPAPEDPSGVIKGWKPTILENENPPAAPAPNAPTGTSAAAPAPPAVPLPAKSTLDRLSLTPEDFLALPKDGQAEVMAMDRVFQNPPAKRPPPPPVDLAAPPSVEQPSEPPAAPVKTMEQMLQEDVAAKKAARLAREAAAQPPAPIPQAASPQQTKPIPPGPPPEGAYPIPEEARTELPKGAPRQAYENAARTAKARGLARWMNSAGVRYEDAARLKSEDWAREAAAAHYSLPSPKTIEQALNELKMMQVKPNGTPAPAMPPPEEPGIPPAADAAPLQPPPASGTLPSDERLQGQGLPGSAVDRRGAPSQGTPIRQEVGANQPAAANATAVLIPGSSVEYPARYELRELADINTSHNGNTFQPNSNYKGVNERDYTRLDNQGKVVTNSGPLFDPRYHITDNPDATNGPPLIGENGSAAGGNGRGMILQRVYATNPRGAQAYRDLLGQKASQFGIDPAQVAQMKQPVLVRVMSNEDAARAAADLNKTGTAALTPAERAIADSKRVSRGTLDDISARMDAIGPDATLKDVLAGRSGAELLNRLIDDGVIAPQERAALAQGDDLTEAGRNRISKLMLGRFFRDPAQMDSISPIINRKLERIAAPVAAAEDASGWGVGEHLKDALDLIESAKAAGRKNLDDFVKQSGLYSAEQFPPHIVDLAKSLQKTTQGQALIAAKNYLEKARYARDYQGPGMFQQYADPSNPQAALAEFLQDIKKPPAPPKPKVAPGNSEPGTPSSPEVPPNPFR